MLVYQRVAFSPFPVHQKPVENLTCFLRTSARCSKTSRRRRCSSKALGCPISSYLRRDLSVSLFGNHILFHGKSYRLLSYLIGFIYPSNYLSIYRSIYLSIYLSIYRSIYLSILSYLILSYLIYHLSIYLVGRQAGMNLSLCPFANSKQCRYANIDNSKGRHPTRTTPKSLEIRSFKKEGANHRHQMWVKHLKANLSFSVFLQPTMAHLA